MPKIKVLNIFANIISIVLHPLIIPTISCIVIFNSEHYISVLDTGIKLSIYLIFFIMTFLLPALFIPVLYYFKVISNIQMNEKKDRSFSLIVTGLMYVVSYYFMSRVAMPDILLKIVLATSVSIVISIFISFFYKISLHSLGIGGLVGFAVFLFTNYNIDMRLYLILFIIASGIIGSARLYLNKHKVNQIFIGWLVGFSCVFLIFKYF